MVCSQVDHSFAMLPNHVSQLFEHGILWAIESYESYDDLCLWVCGIYLKLGDGLPAQTAAKLRSNGRNPP